LERENAQLRAELSRVNAERIEYLQNVSHQLVAPLNAIKWHIENITSNRVGVERAKKVLRSIYSQSTLAVHLAKNFALLSNLDADHALTALKEPLQEVPLLALVINLADDFQPLGWDRDIKISVVADGGLKSAPPVLAMKPLISQAFSNVIENAVKYSKRNSEIVIDGAHRPGTDIVSVTVRNSGIPLAASDLDRVFERGYRTEEAKNAYPAGTGFGLFIAKRIVELHEGTLSAKSTRDGAIFELSLPIRALEGKARQRAPKDNSPYRR
jgi:signal transduction histidine kinase